MTTQAIRLTAGQRRLTADLVTSGTPTLTIEQSGETPLAITLGAGNDAETLSALITQINASNTIDVTAELISPLAGDTSAGDLLAASLVITAGSFDSLTVTEVDAHIPVLERIARDLAAVLATVRSSVEAPGRTLRVLRLSRRHDEQVAISDNTIVLSQDTETWIEERPHDAGEHTQQFMIDCFIAPPDNDDTPTDTIVNRLRADLVRAVMADPTRSGLAIDTWIPQVDTFALSDGAYAGCAMTCSVHYRTDLDDPYTGQLEQ